MIDPNLARMSEMSKKDSTMRNSWPVNWTDLFTQIHHTNNNPGINPITVTLPILHKGIIS